MIPEGTDLWGRIALVTSSPTYTVGGEVLPLHHGPRIGDEIVTVGRLDESDDVAVVDGAGEAWALSPDCLTIVSRFDRPPTPPISPEVASHVLWHYRQIGYPPGSFVSSLINALAGADQGNRALLARGFPDYARAVALATEHPQGIDMLRGVMVNRRPL